MPTFKTQAFGCRVNQAEEEEIQNRMLKSGFVWQDDNPDIYIINTCAVTDKAEREARQLIYNVKRQNPNTFLVITGCSATYWQKNQLFPNLPIDLCVDNINKEYLVKILLRRLSQQKILHLRGVKKGLGSIQKQTIFNKYIDSGRYLIKIQDGCHRFCSYCIVPHLRGSPKSIPTEEIINKISALPKNINEVVLTAINTEAYGKDTGENFLDLVKSVLAETKIPRASFGSIHPWSINNDFLNFYHNYAGNRHTCSPLSNRFVDYFHIPLQSGSNKILNLMKRDYKQAEIAEKLHALSEVNPYAQIGTDIIVGFLDETDSDFEETYQFLEKSPISRFHIFRFNIRKNTAAYFMSKRLKEPNDKIKQERSRKLIALGIKKYRKFQEKLIGKTFSCLILPQMKENYQEGLLSNQIPVMIKTAKKLPSKIIKIKVKEKKQGKLFANSII